MPAPFSILALDLHNTLYDEALEYGLAIEEGVAFWLEKAKQYGPGLKREALCKELAAAHHKLESDWDPEVWRHLPSLARLSLPEADFEKAMKEAEVKRRAKSRELTVSGAYEDVRDTLAALKSRGVRIHIVTEAAADAAMRAVSWLKLGGIVDGVYSYPSRKPPAAQGGTYHKNFPQTGKGFLKKPHPYLLACVMLDEAIHRKEIPDGTQVSDLFSISQDEMTAIAELHDAAAQADAAARLVTKATPHAAALRRTLDSMLYVGDSKFKDGLLARNAGVAFGYAAYGKKIKEETKDQQRRSLAIMYEVTGWDKDTLKLTQEAARSQTVNNLKADFTFENSLSEALGLFI